MRRDLSPPSPLQSQKVRWSPKNLAHSVEDHTSQAMASASSSPRVDSQSDKGTQPACLPHKAGTALPKDHSEAPKRTGRRRRSRKSRAPRKETEMEDGLDRNFASQPNTIPFIPNTLGPGFLPFPQPWAYYPPPGFMIMMPLPFVPVVPMIGPSQWTNINSGNVTNVHMYDVANNNSTNLRIKKGTVLVLFSQPSPLMCPSRDISPRKRSEW